MSYTSMQVLCRTILRRRCVVRFHAGAVSAGRPLAGHGCTGLPPLVRSSRLPAAGSAAKERAGGSRTHIAHAHRDVRNTQLAVQPGQSIYGAEGRAPRASGHLPAFTLRRSEQGAPMVLGWPLTDLPLCDPLGLLEPPAFIITGLKGLLRKEYHGMLRFLR